MYISTSLSDVELVHTSFTGAFFCAPRQADRSIERRCARGPSRNSSPFCAPAPARPRRPMLFFAFSSAFACERASQDLWIIISAIYEMAFGRAGLFDLHLRAREWKGPAMCLPGIWHNAVACTRAFFLARIYVGILCTRLRRETWEIGYWSFQSIEIH